MKFRKPKEGRQWAEFIRETKGKSGVYVIREDNIIGHLFGAVLYVGESHTDRLYSTITRHFQHWRGKTAGPTYDPTTVVVAVVETSAEEAIQTQNDAIAELIPRDNIKENPFADPSA